jgi:hypothetical protein
MAIVVLGQTHFHSIPCTVFIGFFCTPLLCYFFSLATCGRGIKFKSPSNPFGMMTWGCVSCAPVSKVHKSALPKHTFSFPSSGLLISSASGSPSLFLLALPLLRSCFRFSNLVCTRNDVTCLCERPRRNGSLSLRHHNWIRVDLIRCT